MSNYNILKTNIAAQIKQNGAKAITGQILQTHLLSMITSLGAGYQYMGVAALNTNPGTPDYKCFYIATAVGTYSNFGSPALTVAQGEVAIFYYDTAWHKAVTGAASKADVDALIQTLEGEVTALGQKVSISRTDITKVTNNYIVYADGSFVSNGSWYCYWCPVVEGAVINCKLGINQTTWAAIAYYSDPDAGTAAYIGGVQGIVGVNNYTAVVPQGAVVALICNRYGTLATPDIEVSIQNIVPIFESINDVRLYTNSTDKTVNSNAGSIPLFSHLNDRFTLLQQTTPKNLLTDFSKFVYGKYINSSGTIANLASAAIYDVFIPIPVGETTLTAAFGYVTQGLALYDADKVFITTLNGGNSYDKVFDLSGYPTAKFCKLNCKTSTIPTHPDYDGEHPCYAYFGKKYNDNSTPESSIRTYGSAVRKPINPQGTTIAFFGDSIVRGVSSPGLVTLTDCFAKLICDYFGATLVNKGESGSRFCDPDNAATSILNKILNYSGAEPDVIIIAGGTNDYGLQSPIGAMGDSVYSSVFGAVDLICQDLQTNHPNAKVVFVTPINRTSTTVLSINLNEYRNAIWRVAVKYGYSVIDGSEMGGFPNFSEYASPLKTELLQDGLHPTAVGHRYMANFISGLIG